MWSKFTEINEELKLVESFTLTNVHSRNKLLNEIVTQLINAGGKRMRPAFVIISAKFGKYDRKKVIKMAGAIEILHTATLVHDDVVDCSTERRGKVTVCEKFGINMALYTGDFLFTKALLSLSKGIPVDKLDLMARAIKTICEGEVDQYQQRNNMDTNVLSYLKRINRKTAVLFGAACSVGAYLGKCSLKVSRNLTKFGFYYGMAFQIRDDLNDYLADAYSIGKPVGKDIREGVITLPAIYAINHDEKVRYALRDFLNKKESNMPGDAGMLVELIRETPGIQFTKNLLNKYIERALKILKELPANKYREILEEVVYNLQVL